jgi:hypothetical protein
VRTYCLEYVVTFLIGSLTVKMDVRSDLVSLLMLHISCSESASTGFYRPAEWIRASAAVVP